MIYNPQKIDALSAPHIETSRVAKVQQLLHKFFRTLHMCDLEIIQQKDGKRYATISRNIAQIDEILNAQIDDKKLATLRSLTTNSQNLLAAAIRESLPSLLASSKDKAQQQQQKIEQQQKLRQNVREQILYFAEKFALYDSNNLELYAPELWKEIREDLNLIENMLREIDEDVLPVLDTTMTQLLQKLEQAQKISVSKQQQLNEHLQHTQDKLQKFMATIAAIDYPLLLTHKPHNAQELLDDFTKVEKSFFFNESSEALDYRVANAQMDDAHKMLDVSVPVWFDEIATEKQRLLHMQNQLQKESDEDKQLCIQAIKTLRKKRLLASCACIPFIAICVLIVGCYSFFTDIMFLLPQTPVEHIATFYGFSTWFTLFTSAIFAAVAVAMFYLSKQLCIAPYTKDTIKSHSLQRFCDFRQEFHYSALIIIVGVLCIGGTYLGTQGSSFIRHHHYIENIAQCEPNISHLDILEKYCTHPQLQMVAEDTLFAIYTKYRNDPQVQQYDSRYKKQLVAQQNWRRASLVFPHEKLADLFIKNSTTLTEVAHFDKEVLQILVQTKPRKIAQSALQQLIVREPQRQQHWQMVFSFYHDEGKQHNEAIEYFSLHSTDQWVDKIVNLLDTTLQVDKLKVVIKALVILAKRYEQHKPKVAAHLLTVAQKPDSREIALYGLAKIMHPPTTDYLRNNMLSVKIRPVQIQIIQALKQMNDKKCIDNLLVILCDATHYSLRKEAAIALKTLYGKYFALWKKIAQTKSPTTRKKILVKYSVRYKITPAVKYIAQIDNAPAHKALKTLLAHQRKQAQIAVIHTFSGQELTIKKLLRELGYHNIKMVHSIEAVPKVDLIIVAEKKAISQARVQEYIAQGTKMLLLYNCGEILGGAWQQHSTESHRIISMSSGFLGDINQRFSVQKQFDTFFVTSPYPTGWKPYAGNHQGYTILSHSVNEKVQGIMFTYNPLHLDKNGRKLLSVLIDFLLQIKRFDLKFSVTHNE